MFLAKFVLVALVGIAKADDTHWMCESVPSNEWTSHYCTRFLGPRDQSGIDIITGVSTSQPEDASIEEQTYEHLENHDVESVTDFNEAMLILNMPDEMRVDISALHIFSNPPAVGKAEVHDDGDNSVFISGEHANHPHPCSETHDVCAVDAFQPCGPACCSNSTCACASETLGGVNCCVCSHVVQAFVHEKRIHYVNQHGCTQVYVTADVVSDSVTVFHKHHQDLSADYCNGLRH